MIKNLDGWMKMRNMKVYNTPIEVGIRAMVILKQFNMPLDIQQLVFYDYSALHLGDIDDRYESLHPNNPFHATELFVRRKLIQQSIILLASKGLISFDCSSSGLRYKINDISSMFLDYFESEYYNRLKSSVEIVYQKFRDMDTVDINNYIKENIGEWKGELEFESLFRGEDIEEVWI